MDSEREDQGPKLMIAIFVVVLALLCLIVNLFLRSYKPSVAVSKNVAAPTAESTPAPTISKPPPAAAIDVPTKQPQPTPPFEAQPAGIPQNLWKVVKIYTQAHRVKAYVYDLGVFQNTSTGQEIRGYCANPGWPIPEIGELYYRNDWDVLIPVEDNGPPWKQRFIVIRE